MSLPAYTPNDTDVKNFVYGADTKDKITREKTGISVPT